MAKIYNTGANYDTIPEISKKVLADLASELNLNTAKDKESYRKKIYGHILQLIKEGIIPAEDYSIRIKKIHLSHYDTILNHCKTFLGLKNTNISNEEKQESVSPKTAESKITENTETTTENIEEKILKIATGDIGSDLDSETRCKLINYLIDQSKR